jgi:hypothetical protein
MHEIRPIHTTLDTQIRQIRTGSTQQQELNMMIEVSFEGNWEFSRLSIYRFIANAKMRERARHEIPPKIREG